MTRGGQGDPHLGLPTCRTTGPRCQKTSLRPTAWLLTPQGWPAFLLGPRQTEGERLWWGSPPRASVSPSLKQGLGSNLRGSSTVRSISCDNPWSQLDPLQERPPTFI